MDLPKLLTVPFTKATHWSNASYLSIPRQGSVTNSLKKRAKFCIAFPQKDLFIENKDGAIYLI